MPGMRRVLVVCDVHGSPMYLVPVVNIVSLNCEGGMP